MASNSSEGLILWRIEKARRRADTKLSLLGFGMETLPSELWTLTHLESLDLEANRLSWLPPEIGRLSDLKTLDLRRNRLISLPPELWSLTNLTYLDLDRNQLTSLPTEIGRLSNLEMLHLRDNQLASLPVEIGSLGKLQRLCLQGNELTSLPVQLGELESLASLRLEGNPLPDALMAAHERGVGELKAYLRSLKRAAETLYEAKLVMVGEGAVGKTTLLAAMLGEPPPKQYDTTYGIDIRTLPVPHPDPKIDRDITLNAWDFGGQQVYRITHQFFFSRRSLYLLLWRPRMGPEQCDLEGWLKMIRLRVGREARVIIVATHCRSDEHLSRIDQEVLRETYGDIIVDFHDVDSMVPVEDGGMFGVEELKDKIARVAAGLPQMGELFSPKWKAARDEVLALEEPHIGLGRFQEICHDHELDQPATDTLADLMHDLGHVVYYGDDEGLKEEVILRPAWLSKAIAFVLEDREANQRRGYLEHRRLRQIWHDHGIKDRLRYAPELHPFFLRLMEKHDVSYRLEDDDASLVAQLVSDVRPELPWLPGDREGDSPIFAARESGQSPIAQISLVCQMDEVPEGLVPWMTVRTHRFWMPKYHHWQRGLFLEYAEHGTAMLELRGRELVATVRAAWPNYFMDILHDTLEQLIRERWPGLKWRSCVPCLGKIEDGHPCPERFDLEALRRFKADGDPTIRCQETDCLRRNSIDELLTGFKPPEWDIREFADELREELQKASQERAAYASQAAHWARRMLLSLAAETRDCPRMFTLLPENLSKLNPANFGKQGKRLTLWCEMPDDEHPVVPIGSDGPGEYVFKESKEWLTSVGPLASLVARTLKTLVPLGGAVLKAMLDESVLKDVGPALDVMDKACSTLLGGELEIEHRLPDGPDRLVTGAEGAGLRALHGKLLELDKAKQWGGLRRVPAKSGEYLWVCPRHYKQFDPGLPVLPVDA